MGGGGGFRGRIASFNCTVTDHKFVLFNHVLCFARIMSTLCPNYCRQTARIWGATAPPLPPSRTPMVPRHTAPLRTSYPHSLHTIQYNAMRCDAMRCDAMPCDAMQYNTIQYNTIQYNTIQYRYIYFHFHTISLAIKLANYKVEVKMDI